MVKFSDTLNKAGKTKNQREKTRKILCPFRDKTEITESENYWNGGGERRSPRGEKKRKRSRPGWKKRGTRKVSQPISILIYYVKKSGIRTLQLIKPGVNANDPTGKHRRTYKAWQERLDSAKQNMTFFFFELRRKPFRYFFFFFCWQISRRFQSLDSRHVADFSQTNLKQLWWRRKRR